MKLVLKYKKVAITGAVDSGREVIAMHLASMTGLKLRTWEDFEDDPEIEGIVYDAASQERVDDLREQGFSIVRYTHISCDKRISIDYALTDLSLHITSPVQTGEAYRQTAYFFNDNLLEEIKENIENDLIEEENQEGEIE